MNRRKFFSFLGIGVTAAVVAPKALAQSQASQLSSITRLQIALKELQFRRQLTGEPLEWSDVTSQEMIDSIGPIAKGIAKRLEGNNQEIGKKLAKTIPEWFEANG